MQCTHACLETKGSTVILVVVVNFQCPTTTKYIGFKRTVTGHQVFVFLSNVGSPVVLIKTATWLWRNAVDKFVMTKLNGVFHHSNKCKPVKIQMTPLVCISQFSTVDATVRNIANWNCCNCVVVVGMCVFVICAHIINFQSQCIHTHGSCSLTCSFNICTNFITTEFEI